MSDDLQWLESSAPRAPGGVLKWDPQNGCFGYPLVMTSIANWKTTIVWLGKLTTRAPMLNCYISHNQKEKMNLLQYLQQKI